MMNTPPLPPLASGWPMRLACLGLALAPFSSAFAVDGTITITGEIISSTCKINGEAPPHNLLINLPKIGASALKNQGDVAGATPFTLTLTECPSELSGQVRAHFEPGPTTDYDTGNLYAYSNSSGTAKTKESSIPAWRNSRTSKSSSPTPMARPSKSEQPTACRKAPNSRTGAAATARKPPPCATWRATTATTP